MSEEKMEPAAVGIHQPCEEDPYLTCEYGHHTESAQQGVYVSESTRCTACDSGAIQIKRKGKLQHLATINGVPVWTDCIRSSCPNCGVSSKIHPVNAETCSRMDWKTMESAPKMGESVLLFGPHVDPYVGYYDWISEGWMHRFDGERCEPRWWMPLPPYPVEQGERLQRAAGILTPPSPPE